MKLMGWRDSPLGRDGERKVGGLRGETDQSLVVTSVLDPHTAPVMFRGDLRDAREGKGLFLAKPPFFLSHLPRVAS